jgi:hypothetical protein
VKNGYTPKQAAIDITLSAIRAIYHERVGDLTVYCTAPFETKLVCSHLAKLHNNLMQKANLDGLPLEE